MQLIPEVGVNSSDTLSSPVRNHHIINMEVAENPAAQTAVNDKLSGKGEVCKLNGIYLQENSTTDKTSDVMEVGEKDMLRNESCPETEKVDDIVKSIKIEEDKADESMDLDDIEATENENTSETDKIEETVALDGKETTNDESCLDTPKIDNETTEIGDKEKENSSESDKIDDVMEVDQSIDDTPRETNSNEKVDGVRPLLDDVMVMIADFDKDSLTNEKSSQEISQEHNCTEKISSEVIDQNSSSKANIPENEKMDTDVVIKTEITENDVQNNGEQPLTVEQAGGVLSTEEPAEIVADHVKTERLDNTNILNELEKNTQVVSPEENVILNNTPSLDTEDNSKDKSDTNKSTSMEIGNVDTFDVLISDDEADGVKKASAKNDVVENKSEQTTCVSIDDDDDIVLIDDSAKNNKTDNQGEIVSNDSGSAADTASQIVDLNADSSEDKGPEEDKLNKSNDDKQNKNDGNTTSPLTDPVICPLKIMRKIKPTLGDMSREDLEEFCVVKMVEGIAGRSALSDLRLKLKTYEKSMDEWRKKVINLNKQNKDLQIVLKTVCEEQQKRLVDKPSPIKITRSVGLQVGFPTIKANNRQQEQTTSVPPNNPPPLSPLTTQSAKSKGRAKSVQNNSNVNTAPSPVTSTAQANNTNTASKTSTPKKNNPVPTPRLVPANSTPSNPPKPNAKVTPSASPTSTNNSMLKTVLTQQLNEPPKPTAEKRPAMQSIDLTDDEPPAKQAAIKAPVRPPQQTLRPVNPQQLTNSNNRVTTYVVNTGIVPSGPRQVFIPISAQGQNNINSNSIMVPRKIIGNKNNQGIRNFVPQAQQGNQSIRIGQAIPIRPNNIVYQHPAPLPQSVNAKHLMEAGLKWIPPRPSLKIARVDNGIVISWEMEDFSESQHEVIASYQIYAYQEASTQPSTDLWKKIGDVKALPLPMACTLTHFMAGFKYYFAVRAIDVHRRVGPFSSPGNIMLLSNKSGK